MNTFRKTVVPVLAVINAVLALPPFLLFCSLYRLAQRATVLIGHWPSPLINDPKWIGANDSAYQHLYRTATSLESVAFYSLFLWFAVTLPSFYFYSLRIRLMQIGLFVFTWGLLWLHPLLWWWID